MVVSLAGEKDFGIDSILPSTSLLPANESTRYFLNMYYTPAIVLDTRNNSFCPSRAYILQGVDRQ